MDPPLDMPSKHIANMAIYLTRIIPTARVVVGVAAERVGKNGQKDNMPRVGGTLPDLTQVFVEIIIAIVLMWIMTLREAGR